MWTKIYAHSANGAEAFDAVLHMFAPRPTIVTIGKDSFFVGVPALPTARADVADLDGVTVLPAHTSPHPIQARHVALLKEHGADASDTGWTLAEKLFAKHRLPHHFDPSV